MSEISREDAITILHYIFEDIPVYAQPTDEQMIASLNKAISDMEKIEKIEQNLEHIDIAIRCAMCTNSMANDRGCDGGCRINEAIYKKVLDVINKEIEQIVKG